VPKRRVGTERVFWTSWPTTIAPSRTEQIRALAKFDNLEAWAQGLDLIRKTRHYILRNANASLALDVMFGGLIALHRPAKTGAEAPFAGTPAVVKLL
jgi:hypothetical protein